ncbi:hypothetical protein ACFWAY_51975 [Rhodococcus sp. NPDC059968]|uniref:hypothetical protein n=1 Tax=Rhodococcus sp. NPDC059968 TaxID=3347017 RepID=UPI00366AB505
MHSDPAAVAADLEAWCRPGGILDKDGPSASIRVFDPVFRRRMRDVIVDAYLAEQTDVGIGRQFLALATAGPPGVGKSSSIDRRHLAGQGGCSMRTSSRTTCCGTPSSRASTSTC